MLWGFQHKLTIPFWLIVSLTWLLYALDIYTVIVFVIMNGLQTAYNYKMNEFFRKFHKESRELHKERGEVLSQTFTHIKFLKLYGWVDLFYEKTIKAIQKIKDFDQNQRKYHKLRGCFNEFIHHVRPILTYSFFIYGFGSGT